MAHELPGALQQAGRIRQRCAVKEPDVYVRSEYINVAEGRISQTCNRTAVMQKLPDFVPAFSHHLKPLLRDGSQFTGMLFHPPFDGGIPLDSAVESQQFRSHSRSESSFVPAAPFLNMSCSLLDRATRVFHATSYLWSSAEQGPLRRSVACPGVGREVELQLFRGTH